MTSPPYTALMVWLLADSDEVANVVWPRASSVPVPNVVVPSLNVTVPVGVPILWSATVAVNVTDWPNTEGFVEEVNVVVVLSLLTVCVSVGEVLPLTLASPPYTALIGWLLGVNIEIVNIACPELRLTAANGVAPSLKVIVPVAEAGETVAVKVTGWLYAEGFAEEVVVVVELALFTVIAGLVSVLELSAVSVAVTVYVPTVLRVTLNVLVPATRAAFPGNVAAPAVEVI